MPLAHVAAKWQPAALAEFLRDPAARYPDIRMPNYRLSAEESRSVAAFLLALLASIVLCAFLCLCWTS